MLYSLVDLRRYVVGPFDLLGERMPIYEYVCEKCGDHLEVMQRVSDQPLKRCAKCRGKLEKIISRTAFQLKGSGWYKTDYSDKPQSKAAPKSEKKKSEGAGSSESSGSSGSSGSGSSD